MDNSELLQDVVESKAQIRELQLRLDAVITLLEKEGVVLRDEVDAEFEGLLSSETRKQD